MMMIYSVLLFFKLLMVNDDLGIGFALITIHDDIISTVLSLQIQQFSA